MSIIATILFVVLLTLIYFNSDRPTSPTTQIKKAKNKLILSEKRQPAPPLTWAVSNVQKDSLKDRIGQVVYLNFWAMWCTPCIDEIPLISNISNELGPTLPLNIILINLDEGTENIQEAKSFLMSSAPQLQSLFETGSLFVEAFQAEALPTHILIDKKGRVASHFYGDILNNSEDLKNMLKLLIQED